jgi:hypothetical protein
LAASLTKVRFLHAWQAITGVRCGCTEGAAKVNWPPTFNEQMTGEACALAVQGVLVFSPTASTCTIEIKDTGGARKVRFAGKGKGKSGGYRIITYYAAEDVPVFLLDIYSKGTKANLSQAQRNTLRKILSALAAKWRASVRAKVKPLRRPQ